MRVMVLIKGDSDSEAGVMPSEELLTQMGNYNEELVKAGIMLDGNGLHPGSASTRVQFSGGKPTVLDGPFAESKEIVAGYWVWQVDSLEHAIDWVKRMPNPGNVEAEIEIRPIVEADDFGDAFTPELREQHERFRVRAAQNQ